MDVVSFEKDWLHGSMTIEQFESGKIKEYIWQYYRAKLQAQRAIEALDKLISEAGFISFKKPIYIKSRDFLSNIFAQMCDPECEYMVIDRLARANKAKEIQTFQELILDESGNTLTAMWALCDYSLVRGISPSELLGRFPMNDYLEATDQSFEVSNEDGMGGVKR